MITRIQRDVDWSSPNSKAQVTQLIRDMLLAYVQGYLARGDRSLGQYNNRRKSVDLAASHRALLSTSSLIKGLAPEFLNYLENFPTSQIDNAESGISWHIIDFGLKPSITVSHTAVYTQGDGDSKDLYVASKQIYSSRYLDSSLTFTLLLRVRTEAGVDSYLIFIDRSRSDALDGALGGLARKVVQNEATERIEKLLSRAELRLLATANSGDADKTLSDEDENSWTTAITDPRVVIILAGVLGLLLIFVIWRRNRQQVRP
jgi:hypothetical protein